MVKNDFLCSKNFEFSKKVHLKLIIKVFILKLLHVEFKTVKHLTHFNK